MGEKTWARILACGFISGVVWALLGAGLVGLLGRDFLAAVSRAGATSGSGALMFGLTVASGLWAMWMYSIVRKSIGAGFRSAAVVSLAWWLMAGLQSAKWMTLGGIPGLTALPLAIAILPAMLAATMLGAWLYERQK
jgi:hypothetical protein